MRSLVHGPAQRARHRSHAPPWPLVAILIMLPACERAAPDLGQAEAAIAQADGPLCLSHGVATSAISISTDDGELRGTAPGTVGDHATLRFTARGESVPTVPLADGSIRHQLCLMLRAADSCNLVYACWRLEPKPWVQVQVKSNPGKHTSAECGANGYIKITPTWSAPVPSFADGAEHTLSAALAGVTTAVYVDDATVWVGAIDPSGLAVDGPAGVRSDNERWTGELEVTTSCAAGD
jgi:hypothetical protein